METQLPEGTFQTYLHIGTTGDSEERQGDLWEKVGNEDVVIPENLDELVAENKKAYKETGFSDDELELLRGAQSRMANKTARKLIRENDPRVMEMARRAIKKEQIGMRIL